MKRLGGVLLAAVLVAGCVGGPARDPGAVRPGAGEPAATVATPPEAPAKTGPGMLQPAPAFVTLGRGCKPGEIERGPAEPTGIASAVSARIFVREDPGVAAPILAWLGELPVTVAVQFDAPVNPATFALTLQDTRCDYLPGPIEQTVLWLSEKEASIHLRALPAGKPGPYTVSFGQGQDQAGREVREPNFRIQLQTDRRRLRVYAVPVATDGEPRLLLDRNAYLHPRSVSPDGRYLLLVRDLNANANTHSPVRIPYVADLRTGELRAYSRGDIGLVRWDLAAGSVWVSGWQRLTLGGPGDTGRTLLDRLPPGDGRLLNARVSPDGRWLAAVRTPMLNDETGWADFVLVELASGNVRTLPKAVGYLDWVEGPVSAQLVWTDDSSSLLVESYQRGSPPSQGKAEPFTLNPVTLQRQVLRIAEAKNPVVQFSPGGRYLTLAGGGIVTRDGKSVLAEPLTGTWTADDRILLTSDGERHYTAIEIATGRRTSFTVPSTLTPTYVLDISPDVETFYVVRLGED